MTEIHVHSDSSSPQSAFVGVFDVLGFKDMLRSAPLVDIMTSYRSLIDAKIKAARIPVGRPNKVDIEVSGTTIFSDTILIWCDDSWPAVQSFLSTCSVLVADALRLGLPLRGGIAYGDVVLDRTNRIFVGQPIVDAHLTETSQEWLGAAIHPSVISHPTFGSIIAAHADVIAYNVPVKPRASPLSYALHWCTYSTDARRTIERLKARVTNPSVLAKYDATLAYLTGYCANYHANN